MNISKNLSAVAVVATLSACGGSADDLAMEQLSTFPGANAVTPAEARGGQAMLLFTEPDGKNVETSDLAYFAADIVAIESQSPDFDFSAPSVANATYDGLVGLELNRTGELLLGNLTLDADFAADTVSGSASGFTAFQDTFVYWSVFQRQTGNGNNFDDPLSGLDEVEQLSGTLQLTNGKIGTRRVQLDLLSGGTIVTKFDAEMNGTLAGGLGDYQVTTDIEAGFAKVNDQAIVLGQVIGDLVTPDGFAQTASGAVVAAERN